MHKRAFQALKRTFIHVSGLPPTYFDFKKTIDKVHGFFKSKLVGVRPDTYINNINSFFKSNYGWGRPETCINVRFRP